MLPSLTLIIVFQLAGEFLQKHFDSPIPGAVIGMILFFCYLCAMGHHSSRLLDTGGRLLRHLPLLFIPAGVGVVAYTAELKTQGIAIIASLTVGTLVAFIITLLVFQKLNKQSVNHIKSRPSDD